MKKIFFLIFLAVNTIVNAQINSLFTEANAANANNDANTIGSLYGTRVDITSEPNGDGTYKIRAMCNTTSLGKLMLSFSGSSTESHLLKFTALESAGAIGKLRRIIRSDDTYLSFSQISFSNTSNEYEAVIEGLDGNSFIIEFWIENPEIGHYIEIDNLSLEETNTSDTQAPTTPILSTTGQTDTTANLSWTAATDNIGVTGYKIYKDGVLETTLGDVLTYQVTGLISSTSYDFTVTAIDALNNESILSNPVTVTTSNCTNGLITEYKINGTWLSGESTLNLVEGTEVILSGLPNTLVVSVDDPNGQNHSDNFDLGNITTSQSGVYIIKSGSSCSVSLNIIVNPLDSQAPTNSSLSAISQTNTTVDLNWTAATDNIGVTGYNIYKDGVLETTLGNVLTYQVTGLNASTSYDFSVTALDAANNESNASNVLTITTDASGGNTGTGGFWSQNNQDVYYNDGNVGIGTNAPQFKLEVNGTGRFTDNLLIGDPNGARTEINNNLNHKIFATTNNKTVDIDGDFSGGGFVGVYRADNGNASAVIRSMPTSSFPHAGLIVNDLNSTSHALKVVSQILPGDTDATNYIALRLEKSVIVIGDDGDYKRGEGYGLINKFKTSFENDVHIIDDGKLGIGIEASLIPADYQLAVAGKIISEEVKVQLQSTGWPDYVFTKDYKLATLKEVENHIKLKGHLENIPSAEEVKKNGVLLGNMNAKLLQKIEELTLYTIQQQKELELQKGENNKLETRLIKLETLIENITK